MDNYLDQVAKFAATCRYEDIPAETIERTKLVIADSIGAIVGGAAEPEMQHLSGQMATSGGPASVIGTGLKTDPSKAALLNGTAGTFLEMDEGNQFCKGHPGMHTIPAAFALSEALNEAGSSVSNHYLVAAIAVGYEIGARVGIACNLRLTMHPHGTWGSICAAVAVGRLKGFDADKMKTLLNVGSNLSLSTSRRTMLEGGTVRNVFAGVSNQMGVLAGDLVDAGFSGEVDGIAHVFGKVVSDSFAPEEMTVELGRRWEISRNYFKLHSCCRFNHATLDALDKIIASQSEPIEPADIAQISVDTYSLAVELDDPAPRNTLAGKFSVPFAVATTLVHGNSGVGSFTREAIGNQTAQSLAQKVRLNEDPKMSASLPEHRPASIKITLTNGAVLQAATDTNRGDWRDPYSDQELRTKYDDLVARLWKSEQAQSVHGEIMALDQASSVDSLHGAIADAEAAVVLN